MSVKQFTTTVFQMDLNQDQIDFVVGMTGIKNVQEAMEHFAIKCVEFYVDPEAILNSVRETPLKGYFNPNE